MENETDRKRHCEGQTDGVGVGCATCLDGS